MRKLTWTAAALAFAGVLATQTFASAEGAGPSAATCPSVNGNWAAPGPFAVTSGSNGTGHTIFRPTDLGGLGCEKHPVILWSNGAAAVVAAYTELLTHLASHGFIVAAGEGRSSSGQPMLDGLDYLARQNADPNSVFAGKVDVEHVGATGHSLGGGAAVGAGADPRVDTVAPLLGGPFNKPAQLHGPALFTAGQRDGLVWPSVVRSQYDQAAQVPAIYAELRGAGHFEASRDGGRLRGPLTAWFRFHLLADEHARGEFFGPGCGYCTSREWSAFTRNPKAEAIPGP
ncbi:chlorophyllase-like protein [Herbihabitans rhizosphaerae]|uniref:Chlorophyllase-like protein n=1 Tax=Herbihabitans rhizosphaerae TaxID=1872711 RepID=A0A4Q7KIT2_9PSEU|nr:acetylxylan esterase [Herbihabitans rhizosphaerae]RZS36468.1 chlorophyllase-like protein [Herbihabitans rhizosphaerae]